MLKWKAVLVAYAALSFFVFLINLVFTIWAVIRKRMIHNGSFVLYDGSCSNVQSMNTGLHLCINLLSMVLLSGSNYAMQCISAPTRAEVDAAHKENKWLDIGIPSLKNLHLASRKKKFLWGVLLASSLPLHLL